MKTKEEFIAKAESIISSYPILSQLYQAGDPRVVGQLNAIAGMLSLFSETLDVDLAEPFTKARDVTVLAEAAMRGVLPLAKPKKVKALIQNINPLPFTVAVGRKLYDMAGREYVVKVSPSGGVVAGKVGSANGTLEVELEQYSVVNTTVTVTGTANDLQFYPIIVPAPKVGYISEIKLKDGLNDVYEYKPRFLNVAVGEKAYTIESDENKRLIIKLGVAGIIGVQPLSGDLFTLTVKNSEGNFDIKIGDKMNLASALDVNENGCIINITELIDSGSNPMDIVTLREVINYPTVYDESSVFLNNFDFLLRKKISPIDFLSVWNEEAEENVRGSKLANINTIFVAAQKTGVTQIALQNDIKDIIKAADDSYKVAFKTIIEEVITINVKVTITSIYQSSNVRDEIKQLLLEKYGQASPFAQRGFSKIKLREVYALLSENVAALSGDQGGDIAVTVNYIGNDDDVVYTNKAYTRTGNVVSVTFANHGFIDGDFLTFSNATDSALNGMAGIIAVDANTFTYEKTGALGATTGTLSLSSKPHPEKWRYVTNSSIVVTFL